MDKPQKTASKTKSSSSSGSSSSSKIKKDAKEKEEYSSEFLRQKLREYFNHPDFKSTLQKDAIKEIMRGKRDVFISMPTGSGKSLCYQLPGMLHENKITIVFSPLIALIKDQMDHLTKLKICAESLNSKMTVKERERVINDLKSIKPNTKFLYITPEQAATDFFRGLLDSIVKFNKLALVAVDECHCVSEMGHQFRKDYLKLGQLRLRYPTTKWIALTATASKDVTDDVFKQLALTEPKSFKTPCFRKNLFYDIIYKNSIQDDYIHLKEFAQKCLKSKTPDEKPNKTPCGIIYCRTRESVERVAIGLSKQNVATKPYHAGLNDKDRKQIQEDWTNGKFPVICATNSFGMGVDKASVRFVVHWDVPQNIAAYYQESGRAGRDGKPSFCRLYYCRQEVKTINFLLNQQLQKDPQNVKSKRSVKEFDKLIEHCESLRCRHILFSQYFGDQAPPDCKKRQLCDVCKEPKQAEKKLEAFHRLALNAFTSKIMMDADFDGSDLYEGGRNAVREAEASYSVDNDGGDDDGGFGSSTKRDAKAKKETTSLIQKEFERRKQKIELAKKLEQTQTRASGIRIKSSIHTSKISGLDVKKRESYLDFLLKVLKDNAEKATEKPPHELKACDFEDIAAELEYNCFTKNRVLAMYTKAITVERLRIDRSTKNKELLPEIKNHTPKKRTAHGGSAEAMQKDLDVFMKANNISGDSGNNVTDTQNTNTYTTVGFQTARQINNKLKEPNRMKKDPLTQMSINSFFSAAAVKREPEEYVENNENEAEPAQQAKRRRVENEGVRVKSEPMETVDDAPPASNIKNEPIDYDSDGGTEKGSDDETDTETPPVQSKSNKATGSSNSGPATKQKTNHAKSTPQNIPNTQSLPPTEVQNVKMEQNSDDDTDEASDNEGDYRTVSNANQANGYQRNATSVNERPKNQNRTDQRRAVAEHCQNRIESQAFEQRRIRPEPLIEDEPMDMIVAEPVRVNEESIKNEPEDDPIQSDEETDDENQYNTSQYQNRNAERQVQNTRQPDDDQYNFQSDNQQPSTSHTVYQQPSTSSSGNYNSFVSASTSRQNNQSEPYEKVNSVYLQRDKPLYNVGSKSTPQVMADGQQLVRFNQYESQPTVVEHTEVIDDDVGIDFDDLADEIEKYQGDLEQQCNEEIEQLKKINMDELDPKGALEVTKRVDQLKRKKEKIMNEKQKELARKTEEDRKELRDKFMLRLFGLDFDVLSWERALEIDSRQGSESSRRDSSSKASADEKKQKIKYNEFMNKAEIKPEHEKTMKQHRAYVALNVHVHRMKDENKLHTVPSAVLNRLVEDKTVIKNIVDKYLMPHFTKGTINKKQYEIICRSLSKHHYENNDYDTEAIRQRVNNMVNSVVNARQKKT